MEPHRVLEAHELMSGSDTHSSASGVLQHSIRQLQRILATIVTIRQAGFYTTDPLWNTMLKNLEQQFGEIYAFAVPFTTYRVANFSDAYNCEHVFREELAALGSLPYDDEMARSIAADFVSGDANYQERAEFTPLECRHMIAALRAGLKMHHHDTNVTKATVGHRIGRVIAVAIEVHKGTRERGTSRGAAIITFAVMTRDSANAIPQVFPGFQAEVSLLYGQETHFALLGIEDPENLDNLQLQETRDGEKQQPIPVTRNVSTSQGVM